MVEITMDIINNLQEQQDYKRGELNKQNTDNKYKLYYRNNNRAILKKKYSLIYISDYNNIYINNKYKKNKKTCKKTFTIRNLPNSTNNNYYFRKYNNIKRK